MPVRPRILRPPDRRQSDTRRDYLDRLQKHRVELKRLVTHWEDVGWNSPEQRAAYQQYAKELLADINTLEAEIRGEGRG